MSISIKSGNSLNTLFINEQGQANVSVENTPDIQLWDRYFERNIMNSPYGHLSTVEITRLVGPAFHGATLDTNFWTATEANGGTVTLSNNQAIVRTNGAANGEATLTSVRYARFIPGLANHFRSFIRFNSTSYDGNRKRWGLFVSTTDGYFFEYYEGTLKIVSRKTSADTAVASGDFNGEESTFVMDTDAHTYEIIITANNIWFLIDDVVMHKLSSTSTILSDTFTFRSQVSNVNSGGGAVDTFMEVSDLSIFRLGKEAASPKSVNITLAAPTTTVCKRGPGRLKRIIINTVPAGAGTLVIYDGVSAGTPIIGSLLLTAAEVRSIEYGVDFYTGLTIVTDTSAGDYTIVYD